MGNDSTEEPGIEKAEFVLRSASGKSLHQAKRQAGDGKWTLSELSSKTIRTFKRLGNSSETQILALCSSLDVMRQSSQNCQ